MDPIADFFIRIKNGYQARKGIVVVPHSKMKGEIAKLLEAKQYLAGIEKKGRKVRKFLELRLRYVEGRPALTTIRRISRVSRRRYIGASDIRPVRQGFGLLILSTSQGILSGADAKKAGVGGEIIAEVW